MVTVYIIIEQIYFAGHRVCETNVDFYVQEKSQQKDGHNLLHRMSFGRLASMNRERKDQIKRQDKGTILFI